MSTPEHADCASFDCGCAVCVEAHGKALKVQKDWLEKARALNIPLSAKGHTVGQRGTYTGVAIDTFSGRFWMLPEKLQSMTDARVWFRRGRGAGDCGFIINRPAAARARS